MFFSGILEINVAKHVFANVVTDNHIKDLAIIAEFFENIREEFLKMVSCLLQILFRYGDALGKSNCSGGVLVHSEE